MNFKRPKKIFVTMLPLLAASLSGHAQETTLQPNQCPTAAAIASVGVSQNAVEMSNGLWLTGRRNQLYHTTSRWTLLMGNIVANTRIQAYEHATAALSTLAFDFGPVQGPLGKWVCYYHNAKGFQTTTLNPPIAQVQDRSYFKAVN